MCPQQSKPKVTVARNHRGKETPSVTEMGEQMTPSSLPRLCFLWGGTSYGSLSKRCLATPIISPSICSKTHWSVKVRWWTGEEWLDGVAMRKLLHFWIKWWGRLFIRDDEGQAHMFYQVFYNVCHQTKRIQCLKCNSIFKSQSLIWNN